MAKRPKITIHKSAEGFYALQRMRSDEGRYWTKKMKLSDPAELAKAKPEDIWTTGDGRQLLVRDMETAHIVRAMAQIYNKFAAEYCKSFGAAYEPAKSPEEHEGKMIHNVVLYMCFEQRPVYKTMIDELEYRTGKKKRPEKAERLTVNRKFNFD